MISLEVGDYDDVRTKVRRALATARVAPVTEEQLGVVIDVLRAMHVLSSMAREDAYHEGYEAGVAAAVEGYEAEMA